MNYNNFENSLIKELKHQGILPPVTENEIPHFEEVSDSLNIPPIPESIKDAKNILKRGLSSPVVHEIDNSSHALRIAARKGNKLTDDVLERMKRDRQESRKEDQG